MFRKVARRNTLGFDEFDDDFFRNLQRFFIFFTHEYPSRFSVGKPVRWGMALTTMDKTGRGKQEETGHAPPRFFAYISRKRIPVERCSLHQVDKSPHMAWGRINSVGFYRN